jgi:hypothetical protein
MEKSFLGERKKGRVGKWRIGYFIFQTCLFLKSTKPWIFPKKKKNKAFYIGVILDFHKSYKDSTERVHPSPIMPYFSI